MTTVSNPLALSGEVAGILAVLGAIYRVASVVAKILIELRANSKATAQNAAATSAISGKLDDHMSLVRQTLDDHAKRL